MKILYYIVKFLWCFDCFKDALDAVLDERLAKQEKGGI